MSAIQVVVQFIAAPKAELRIDSVSLLSDGAERVQNGTFDDIVPFLVTPPDWIGSAESVPGLSGVCARTEEGVYQIVEAEQSLEFSFEAYMRGKGSMYLSVTTKPLGSVITWYWTKDGWGTTVQPCAALDASEWERVGAARLEFPAGTPQIAAGILSQAIVSGPSADEPGVKATIAKAGLAIAGLARCGFYPRNTDTITEPAADPPVFTGGTYAYKKDLEGLE